MEGELSKIEVSGGTPEQTTNFYTALYHTMIHPNVFNDVDGQYKGHDGKIHQLPNYSNHRGTDRRVDYVGRSAANPGRKTRRQYKSPRMLWLLYLTSCLSASAPSAHWRRAALRDLLREPTEDLRALRGSSRCSWIFVFLVVA